MAIDIDLAADRRLDQDLCDRVLERLGFAAPPCADLEGLQELFEAWCVSVPFDNVRKMIALRAADRPPLPGAQADEFFTAWLADGSGGTCWPINNALHVLLRALGFDARRIVGQMRDLGEINHASLKVHLDGRAWLVDFPLLHDLVLPLDREVFIDSDPVFPVEMELLDDGSHRVWADIPPNPTFLPCRLLAADVTHAEFVRRYEASRGRSPFNQRLYARRDRAGELLLLTGNTRISKTAAGITSCALSGDELRRALRDDIGLSERLIDAWVRSGSLDDSLAPTAGPPPPAPGAPPSLRCR